MTNPELNSSDQKTPVLEKPSYFARWGKLFCFVLLNELVKIQRWEGI